MQAYRLVIGPGGNVKIPDGEPGQTVTVLVENSPRSVPIGPFKPVAAMTRDERERLKADFLERGRRVRVRLNARTLIDSESELYGDDGLPR